MAMDEGNRIVKIVGADSDIPVTTTIIDGKTCIDSAISAQPDPFVGTSMGDGDKTVATSGVRQQLSDTSIPSTVVLIIAKSSNTGTIWVGGPTVAVGRGRPLLSLQSEMIRINNLNKVYLDADTNGDGVTFLYLL
jgi:hypothetical protein